MAWKKKPKTAGTKSPVFKAPKLPKSPKVSSGGGTRIKKPKSLF